MKSYLVIACLVIFVALAAFAGDSTQGVISTVAGTGTQGSSGDGGPATLAQLNGIADIAVDTAGNLYIAESNAIRKVSPDGVISTVLVGSGGEIAVDSGGNIYIGPETYRQTEQSFSTEALEPQVFKGKTQPIRIYRVIGWLSTPPH